MAKQAGERKYQYIWNEVKASTDPVEVSIPEYQAYTQPQLTRIMKTIRKAVINEKCRDYAFKIHHRNSQLDISFDKEKGKIQIKLIRDTTDCTELFA